MTKPIPKWFDTAMSVVGAVIGACTVLGLLVVTGCLQLPIGVLQA